MWQIGALLKAGSRQQEDSQEPLQRFEPIFANGRSFDVEVVTTRNKNSYASVRHGMVQIRIPRRLGGKESSRVANEMYLRMKRAIERRPGRYIDHPLAFSDGQRVSVMGAEFCMHITHESRKGGSGRIRGQDIYIALPESLPQERNDKLTASIARRLVYRSVKPRLAEYVDGINRQHFNSAISDVRMHGGSSRWGSCSPDGTISLSFNLMFMPQEFLEYVVVHELAHTRVRGHTGKFWNIVGTVIPDYKKRRRRLNEYGECDTGTAVASIEQDGAVQ
jgi:hypothetical protein